VLSYALKEWAVICRLLADGRQSILLRKGGIGENGGHFCLEHDRFWLYPTYVHQQTLGIRPEFVPLLKSTQDSRPPLGIVRLTHFATAPRAFQASRLETLLCLQDLHGWSEETVRSRFAYRRPGLFVIPVRAYGATQPYDVFDLAEYAGCRSWVELVASIPTENATPVLSDEAFTGVIGRLEAAFHPR
jgi:hypothetical protein